MHKIGIISENRNSGIVKNTINRGQSRILRPFQNKIFYWNFENKEEFLAKKQHLLMLQMLDLKDNNDLCKNHLSSWKKRQNMTQKVFMYIFSTLMIMTQYSTAATMM